MGAYEKIVHWESQAAAELTARNVHAALRAHEQAIVIAESLAKPRLLAVLYNRLGNDLALDNRIQDAVIAYEAGLQALAGHTTDDIDRVLNSLRMVAKGFESGFAFLETPDLYSEATALDLTEAENDPVLAVKLLINIGNAYLRQPQMAPARNAYEQALLRPEITNAPVLRAHALTHIAIIERRQGNVDSAEGRLHEALQLLETHGDPVEKRRALATLASIYREQRKINRALQSYQEALILYQQDNDPRGEARTRAALGHLYLLCDQQADAAACFQRAVQLAEVAHDDDTLWHAYWGVGLCQHRARNLAAAAHAFRQSLDRIKLRRRELRTDEGKVTFLESVQDIFDHLIAVHLDRAQLDSQAYQDVLAVAEEARGQALFDLMGTRRRRLYSKESGIRASRLQATPLMADSPVQMAPGVNLPQNMAAQMAPAVASAPTTELSALFHTPIWNEDVADLHNRMELAGAVPSTVPQWQAEGEALPPPPNLPPLAHLIFHVLVDRTAIVVVTAEGVVHGHVAPVGHAALTKRVAQARRALQVDDAPRAIAVTRHVRLIAASDVAVDYREELRALYAELIAPIAVYLPTDGTPVVLEPHDPLWLLPFAALLDENDQWLADRWPLLYTPSTQVLQEIRSEADYGGPNQLKPLIVGNPTMPALAEQDGLTLQLQPLPGAEAECAAIQQCFADAAGTLLLGDAANWAQVVAQMPHHGIIHLATHGFASAERPLASFIVLAPSDAQALQELATQTAYSMAGWLINSAQDSAQRGMLTAEQLLYLPLPVDLITLSACQTGLGQVAGEGVIGLSRSLLVAGARSVLVSLWSISDSATAELMRAFYEGYRAYDNKAVALQRAMQLLRSRPGYDHPRFWAPFVVIGAEA